MLKIYFVNASRKNARGSCVVKKGSGKITINKKPIDVLYVDYKKEIVLEPTYIAPSDFEKYDFEISMKGGGVMSQVQVARACIAKGMLKASNDNKELKDKFMNYDRHLLVDDVRTKEAKKQLGRGARAKKQHSKR